MILAEPVEHAVVWCGLVLTGVVLSAFSYAQAKPNAEEGGGIPGGEEEEEEEGETRGEEERAPLHGAEEVGLTRLAEATEEAQEDIVGVRGGGSVTVHASCSVDLQPGEGATRESRTTGLTQPSGEGRQGAASDQKATSTRCHTTHTS